MTYSASDRIPSRRLLLTAGTVLGLLLLSAPGWCDTEEDGYESYADSIGTGRVEEPNDTLSGIDTEEEEARDSEEPVKRTVQVPGFRGKFEVDVEPSPGDIVRFGEDLVISPGDTVKGEVVIFGGNLDVYGVVEGAVAVFGGDLHLHRGAWVGDDVVVMMGALEKEKGVVIEGDEIPFGGLDKLREIDQIDRWLPKHHIIHANPYARVGKAILLSLLSFGFFFIVALIFLEIFKRPTARIAYEVQQQYLRAGLVGVLGVILSPLAFVILTLTIIGILLWPVLLAVLAVGPLWGAVGVSLVFGRTFGRKILSSHSGAILRTLIGWVLLHVALFFGWILSALPAPISFLGWTLFIAGWIILLIASLVGFGAVLFTRFGSRGPTGEEEPPVDRAEADREVPPSLPEGTG